MNYYKYKNQVYTLRELSQMSGIHYTTLAERLKRGYTVEEAISDGWSIPDTVRAFVSESNPSDWDGMINSDLYFIYNRWCGKNEYEPESKVHFFRSLRKLLPTVRIVPSRVKQYDGITYKRVIRVDNDYEP